MIPPVTCTSRATKEKCRRGKNADSTKPKMKLKKTFFLVAPIGYLEPPPCSCEHAFTPPPLLHLCILTILPESMPSLCNAGPETQISTPPMVCFSGPIQVAPTPSAMLFQASLICAAPKKLQCFDDNPERFRMREE
jgi:hypothetical protein